MPLLYRTLPKRATTIFRKFVDSGRDFPPGLATPVQVWYHGTMEGPLGQKGGCSVTALPDQALQAQLDALACYYQSYTTESTQQEAETKGLRQLGSWFVHSQRFSNDSMHQKFYNGVKAQVEQLDAALAALPAQEAAQGADQAISILLQFIPESQRDVGGWMRFAAEPLCQPLLAYLTRDALQALYDRYNQFYPKRLQFPAQVKLRREMERLLRQARG